ncbi:MAG: sigma-70 family RNA polymerase sigma factor [Isosphaeraceae bacterium]|nr:sigma-70 family RNA polymerase sigma factor [Isosphaeraceae bacterium]
MNDPRELVEHFFRHESGRLVALLTRSLGVGRLDLVEDVVQSALARALLTWSRRGVPDDPAAWLYRAARNLALDALRRDRVRDKILPRLAGMGEPVAEPLESPRFAEEIGDEPLRLLFLCCHDAVPLESRVALALRTVCGFSTPEIARALLTSEANAQKRIVRAKERLRDEPDLWELHGLPALRGRLDAVLATIYLLFNEGYAARADEPIRRDLCDEAARLGRMLVDHPAGDDPRVSALLALIGFHSARFDARLADGAWVLLDEQDRSKWDWAAIREAMRRLQDSLRGETVSRYHVEAAIAWEHCRAPSFEATDWRRIIDLYIALDRIAPSPVALLNRAIAESRLEGPRAALARLESVPASRIPVDYPLWHAVLGDLHLQAGNLDAARAAWTTALSHRPGRADADLLRKRLDNTPIDAS